MRALPILTLLALTGSANAAEPARRFVAVEERAMEQAEAIPISSVEWKDTTLGDALEFLRSVARAHDPKHKGIPIEMHVQPEPMVEYLPHSMTPKPTPPGGWPIYDPLQLRVTVSLHNTSLWEALRHATGIHNLLVISSRTALTIEPLAESIAPLRTQTIPLTAAPKAEIQKMRANPKQYFIEHVAIFSEGATCSLKNGGATLIVTNTGDQIDLLHSILENLVTDKPAEKSK